MHVDPPTITPAIETQKGTAREERSGKSPAKEVFAAVLSGLTPAAARSRPPATRPPSGEAAPGDASHGADPSGAGSAAGSVAAATGALRTVAGQPARPGLIEVPRDEQGLPLISRKPGGQPAPGTSGDDPEAGRLDGRPTPPSAQPEVAAEAESTKPQTATAPPAEQDGTAEPRAGAAASTGASPPPAAAGPRPAMVPPELAATLPPGIGATGAAGSAASMPTPRAAETHGQGTTAAVDPRQIQAQVARQVLAHETAAGDGPGTLTLRLEPEHLGKVEVRLRASGGQLTVEFQAESAEAGAALREGRHELVRALGAQAGRWQQVEVRVADPERPGAETEEHEEERSEHGSGRERDPDERRRERGER